MNSVRAIVSLLALLLAACGQAGNVEWAKVRDLGTTGFVVSPGSYPTKILAVEKALKMANYSRAKTTKYYILRVESWRKPGEYSYLPIIGFISADQARNLCHRFLKGEGLEQTMPTEEYLSYCNYSSHISYLRDALKEYNDPHFIQQTEIIPYIKAAKSGGVRFSPNEVSVAEIVDASDAARAAVDASDAAGVAFDASDAARAAVDASDAAGVAVDASDAAGVAFDASDAARAAVDASDAAGVAVDAADAVEAVENQDQMTNELTSPSEILPVVKAQPGSSAVNARQFIATILPSLDPSVFTKKEIKNGQLYFQINNVEVEWTAAPSADNRSVILEHVMFGYPRQEDFKTHVTKKRRELSSTFHFGKRFQNGQDREAFVIKREMPLTGRDDVQLFESTAIDGYNDLVDFIQTMKLKDLDAAGYPVSELNFGRAAMPRLRDIFCSPSDQYYYKAFNRRSEDTCSTRFDDSFIKCVSAPVKDPSSGIQWRSMVIDDLDEEQANIAIIADCIRFHNASAFSSGYYDKDAPLSSSKFVATLRMESPHLLEAVAEGF